MILKKPKTALTSLRIGISATSDSRKRGRKLLRGTADKRERRGAETVQQRRRPASFVFDER